MSRSARGCPVLVKLPQPAANVASAAVLVLLVISLISARTPWSSNAARTRYRLLDISTFRMFRHIYSGPEKEDP